MDLSLLSNLSLRTKFKSRRLKNYKESITEWGEVKNIIIDTTCVSITAECLYKTHQINIQFWIGDFLIKSVNRKFYRLDKIPDQRLVVILSILAAKWLDEHVKNLIEDDKEEYMKSLSNLDYWVGNYLRRRIEKVK